MPALPSWRHRVPEILNALNAHGAPPFLDRPAVEKLFGLSRRQSTRLMGSVGGYQIGRAYLVDRAALVSALQALSDDGAVAQAVQRKRRILAAVNEASRQAAARQTAIRARPDALARLPADLPASIERAGPGALRISYRDAEDLLATIVELASAAANDFPRFRALFEEPR